MRRPMAAAALRRIGGIDRSLVARGLDAAGQVGAAAAEVVRVRRDPSAAALRRRLAARRRVQFYSVGAAAGAAVGLVGLLDWVHGQLGLGTAAATFFGALVLCWALAGLVRWVGELCIRSRAVAALPPPQPARVTVHAAVRPLMQQLSEHSDGLRALTAMIGVAEDATVIGLRREILSAADRAEEHLRGRAAAYSTLARTRRSAPPEAVERLDRLQRELLGQLQAGVAEYGRLVGSAADAVQATRSLQTRLDRLDDMGDRLRGLAAGMRELAAE